MLLEKTQQLINLQGLAYEIHQVFKKQSQLNNLNLSKKELITIGLRIGSDVPFFINEEKIKLVSGRGEIFKKFNSN